MLIDRQSYLIHRHARIWSAKVDLTEADGSGSGCRDVVAPDILVGDAVKDAATDIKPSNDSIGSGIPSRGPRAYDNSLPKHRIDDGRIPYIKAPAPVDSRAWHTCWWRSSVSHRGCGRTSAGVGGGGDSGGKGATGACHGVGAAPRARRGGGVGGVVVVVVGDLDHEFPLGATATGWGLAGRGRSRRLSCWSARAEGRRRARSAGCDRSDGSRSPGRGSGRSSGSSSSVRGMMDVEDRRVTNRVPGKKGGAMAGSPSRLGRGQAIG